MLELTRRFTGGWWGLTAEDNQQAVAICKVMKQFTDKGVEVWLRFAHEVNYYQGEFAQRRFPFPLTPRRS